MANEFDWTASETADSAHADRRYDEQSEALAVALMVDRQAVLLLSAFAEHPSDHERIAACRRAFRSAARFIHGTKVRTTMLRDSDGTPAAVLGYIDAPTSEGELRRSVNELDF